MGVDIPPARPPARHSRAQPSRARLATVTPAPGRAEHIIRLLAKSSALLTQIWGLWKEMEAQRKEDLKLGHQASPHLLWRE